MSYTHIIGSYTWILFCS